MSARPSEWVTKLVLFDPTIFYKSKNRQQLDSSFFRYDFNVVILTFVLLLLHITIDKKSS